MLYQISHTFALDLTAIWTQVLLSGHEVKSIPLLVLFNKNDLKEALPPEALIKALELDLHSKTRTTAYFSISCKTVNNIDVTLDWLIKQRKNN
mmetsp:Transcript_24682/g.38948  ORF Transcript_24682/g.38948 Transcript_24682/m.38948 type:complete len:93 (+) Transcript_24682:353-631(+)